MAFNFNWTPLTADSEFYSRAKTLLTTALNKSPKPPIIVSDILVNELNLGSTPPELEILEIGDLAEDRFRGIFKMSYQGDAYVTLKTRVQANPLNTYLSTTPSFTSPRPLAASSPLTIPIQITLSSFRLSGFVILVFSKNKGVTLVFRNDPLESLNVSSTFDSIPFIAQYLQKEIEQQLRNLFQEELPTIIHKLSLQWCNPDYAASLLANLSSKSSSVGILSKPAVGERRGSFSSLADLEDSMASTTETKPLSLAEINPDQPAVSQRNIRAVRQLLFAQNTLALDTPPIKRAVYRPWANLSYIHRHFPHYSPSDSRSSGSPPMSPFLVRTLSDINFGALTRTAYHQQIRRPGITYGWQSDSGTRSLSGGVMSDHASNGRVRTRKKTRVVNLRKNNNGPTSTMSSPGLMPTPLPGAREEFTSLSLLPATPTRHLPSIDGRLDSSLDFPEISTPATLRPVRSRPRQNFAGATDGVLSLHSSQRNESSASMSASQLPPLITEPAVESGPDSSSRPVSSSSAGGFRSTSVEKAWMMKVADQLAQQQAVDDAERQRIAAATAATCRGTKQRAFSSFSATPESSGVRHSKSRGKLRTGSGIYERGEMSFLQEGPPPAYAQ